MVLGGVAGICGGAGAFWCSSGGIFVKGPWGFYVAAGYFELASVGGVVCTGGLAGLAVGGLVYFVPWDKVMDWIRSKFSCIWDRLKECISYVWEKIKQISGNVFKVGS